MSIYGRHISPSVRHSTPPCHHAWTMVAPWSTTCRISCPAKVAAFFNLLIISKARQSGDQYVRIGRWSGILETSSCDDHDRPRRLVSFAPPMIQSVASEVELEQSSPSNMRIERSPEISNPNFHLSLAGDERDTPVDLRTLERREIAPADSLQDCSTKRRRRRRSLRHAQVLPDEEATDPLELSRDDATATPYTQDRVRVTLTQPLMERKGWECLRGDELQTDPDGSLLDAFTLMCQQVCTTEASDWIDWKPTGKHGDLEDGAINVWVGRAVRRGGGGGKSDDEYCGGHLPIIKSQSIVPLTPAELADLLLDSSRVLTYNKWSLGRRDMWVHPDADRRAKIVKNRTKPPVGSKPLVSTTLMHARTVSLESGAPTSVASSSSNADSWIVVSRAIGGTLYREDADADCGRSDILLGVNLLQPVGDDSSLVTAITHVQSTIVPALLAEGLGVKGAIQFVQDLRRLRSKVPA
jgi:hypothetical protein